MILSIKQTKSCNIDFKTLFASKTNGDIVTVGNLMIQAGWTQFLGNNRNTIEVPIAFPKQFKKIFSITASFNGYKNGERAGNIAELNIPVRTGNAIEPTSITNDGCKLMATSQGNFGSAWHGVSWIAVGEI